MADAALWSWALGLVAAAGWLGVAWLLWRQRHRPPPDTTSPSVTAAQLALQASEERLRQAIRAARIGIFDHDHASGVVHCSPVFREMHGFGADEAVHIEDLRACVHPDDLARVSAAVARSGNPAGDGHFDTESRLIDRQGRLHWVVTRAITQFEGEGAARRRVRTIGALNDITERREAELALQTSEERLRQAVRVGGFGVFEHDHRGNTLYCSAELRRLHGFSADEPVTQQMLDERLHPDDRAAARSAMARAHDPAGDGLMALECRIRTPDGREHWVEARAQSLFEGEGAQRRLLRTVGAVSDVTARRRTDEQIKRLNAELEQRVQERTAELEATVRELEAFSYSVSHDLRAPLRGIEGYASVLAAASGSRLDDAGREHLARLRRNATRMGQLIDDLMKLARASSGALSPRDCDLSQLARSVVATLRERHPERAVGVVVEPGLRGRADLGLLMVALENLIGNAWKYSLPTAQAQIEFGAVDVDGNAAYFVRDNGVGFDMAQASRLFTPFQRLHSEQAFEGTGIGLATVRRIVDRHGGRVWAESAPGRGASFYFTLGLRDARALAGTPTPRARAS